MITLVIPLTDKPDLRQYAELRYCLRSFAVNAPWLDEVVIVSAHLPKCLNPATVTFLECRDTGSWSDYNIIHKIKAACAGREDIIWTADDNYVLKPTTPDDYYARSRADLSTWDEGQWEQKLRITSWYNRLRNTVKYTKARGGTMEDFDSHCPVKINGRNFMDVLNSVPMSRVGRGYTINSLYFNLIREVPIPASDVAYLVKDIAGATFLNCNRSINFPSVQTELEKMFPLPCRYER